MGEANKRKQTDRLYGKVPKHGYERGLVVSAPLDINGTSITVSGRGLDAQELRFSLLFWDELYWPQNPLFGFGESPEVSYLEELKILRRAMLVPEDGDVATAVAKSQISAFKALDAAEPGKWALAQGERSFNLITPAGDLSPGASIELYKAIPVPNHDIPLEEILEFKSRRRDELLLLRSHLESLSNEISTSEEPNAAIMDKISEVDEACANLISVSKEWQFPMKLSSMKATLNIDPTKLVTSTGAAYIGASYLGISMASTIAALSAAGSLINIKADIGFQSVKRPANPYRYVYQIERDLK